MKYKIKSRKLEKSDFCETLPFPKTDNENYESSLRLLIVELNSIATVVNVNEENGIIIIESELEDKDAFWNTVEQAIKAAQKNMMLSPFEQLT